MGYIDPDGLVRWGDVVSNTLGVLGSGVGVGSALIGAPTGVSQVLGGAVIANSMNSWGSSWYGLTRALSDDSGYDIPENYQTLPRATASSMTCNKDVQKMADIVDLGIDFASGRAVAGYAPNMSGYLKAPVGYSPLNSNMLSHPATYGELSSKKLNLFSDILSGTQAYQYGTGAWK